MKVYGLWYGGSSYAFGGLDNLEAFTSIEELKTEFYDRYHIGRGCFDYVNDAEMSGCTGTPCVDETSEVWMFLGDIDDIGRDGDLYPDRIVSFGPKMGIKMERV